MVVTHLAIPADESDLSTDAAAPSADITEESKTATEEAKAATDEAKAATEEAKAATEEAKAATEADVTTTEETKTATAEANTAELATATDEAKATEEAKATDEAKATEEARTAETGGTEEVARLRAEVAVLKEQLATQQQEVKALQSTSVTRSESGAATAETDSGEPSQTATATEEVKATETGRRNEEVERLRAELEVLKKKLATQQQEAKTLQSALKERDKRVQHFARSSFAAELTQNSVELAVNVAATRSESKAATTDTDAGEAEKERELRVELEKAREELDAERVEKEAARTELDRRNELLAELERKLETERAEHEATRAELAQRMEELEAASAAKTEAAALAAADNAQGEEEKQGDKADGVEETVDDIRPRGRRSESVLDRMVGFLGYDTADNEDDGDKGDSKDDTEPEPSTAEPPPPDTDATLRPSTPQEPSTFADFGPTGFVGAVPWLPALPPEVETSKDESWFDNLFSKEDADAAAVDEPQRDPLEIFAADNTPSRRWTLDEGAGDTPTPESELDEAATLQRLARVYHAAGLEEQAALLLRVGEDDPEDEDPFGFILGEAEVRGEKDRRVPSGRRQTAHAFIERARGLRALADATAPLRLTSDTTARVLWEVKQTEDYKRRCWTRVAAHLFTASKRLLEAKVAGCADVDESRGVGLKQTRCLTSALSGLADTLVDVAPEDTADFVEELWARCHSVWKVCTEGEDERATAMMLTAAEATAALDTAGEDGRADMYMAKCLGAATTSPAGNIARAQAILRVARIRRAKGCLARASEALEVCVGLWQEAGPDREDAVACRLDMVDVLARSARLDEAVANMEAYVDARGKLQETSVDPAGDEAKLATLRKMQAESVEGKEEGLMSTISSWTPW